MSDATFTAPNGQDPATHFQKLTLALEATVGDHIEADSILVTRIRQRTVRGVDVDGATFPEYSAGYAKQKIKHLGSANPVDLFGFQNHPHMLNAIMIRAGSSTVDTGRPGLQDPSSDSSPLAHSELGFYGDEAIRAQVHNEGTGKMPQRKFFAANSEDIRLMEAACGERAETRMKRV